MKPFDFQRFCEEHGLDFVTEGHTHTRPGWVQVVCPFCSGNPGYHLGYDTLNNRFNCWRCGFHKTKEVVRKLINCSEHEYFLIREKFTGKTTLKEKTKRKVQGEVHLPVGTSKMKRQHRQYLRERKFNPKTLEKEWDVQGTNHIGDHNFRIVIPIYYKGRLVSYQARDITGRSDVKYLSCVGDIKRYLYGIDKVPGNTVVVCEGVFDVWRLGAGAVATFGITYKRRQVELISQFKKVFVLYDSVDEQANKQAFNLGNELGGMGCSVEIIMLEYEDPAEMPQKEANDLMKDLVG